MEKIYWTMKNGQKIDVDDMSESHLRNTLKMIIRNTNKNKEIIEREFESCRREAIIEQEDLAPYHEDWRWK